MSNVIDTLVEMGFSKDKAELAISKTGTGDVQTAMEWLLSHNEELDALNTDTLAAPENNSSESPKPDETTSSADETPIAKSIRCDDCGKLFRTSEEVEFHASKSGHENFSESTEEKKALSEDEKKEQLAKIEAKLKQRRMEREAREKEEALLREKNRIKSGKELLEAKKKHEELEMKKIVEQRKREKEEERLAKQRVREQIEQDKLARKAKFGQGVEEPAPPVASTVASKPIVPKTPANYTEAKIQIKLTNGSALCQTFGAKEPLSAVRLYVEINRQDGEGPFNLMQNYPKKVFTPEDYDKPLETLGLVPSAVLFVLKC